MRKPFIVLSFVLFYITSLLYQGCNDSAPSTGNQANPPLQRDCPNQTDPFPSYAGKYGPPDWWCEENKVNEKDYPIFQLSQNYPKNYQEYINSDCPEHICKWKKKENNFWETNGTAFGETQNKYLKEVISYAFEGNLEIDWAIHKKIKGEKWFHAPYMHLDIVNPPKLNPKDPQCQSDPKPEECREIIEEKVGREFIHGLTMERTGCLRELMYKVEDKPKSCDGVPTQSSVDHYQSWAVSFYNERGASYIGKVWDEMLNPASGSAPNPQNFSSGIPVEKQGFPEGTVAVKLLFTQAPPDKVPYLKGSIEWQADTADFIKEKHEGTKRVREAGIKKENCPEKKCFSTLRLLQIDIAIRDNRSPMGWVFATFIYNEKAEPFINYNFSSEGERNGKMAWLKIEPTGLMFGNDPQAVKKGDEIKESLLNTSLHSRIPQHYGCGDETNPLKRRLNGPVDNPVSSCISCHSLSETPGNLQIDKVPYKDMGCENEGDKNIAYWFRNINPRNSQKPNELTFTSSTPQNPIFSLDYSLQLREGISRYCMNSYLEKVNKCNLTYNQNDKLFNITKEGVVTFTVQ